MDFSKMTDDEVWAHGAIPPVCTNLHIERRREAEQELIKRWEGRGWVKSLNYVSPRLENQL